MDSCSGRIWLSLVELDQPDPGVIRVGTAELHSVAAGAKRGNLLLQGSLCYHFAAIVGDLPLSSIHT